MSKGTYPLREVDNDFVSLRDFVVVLVSLRVMVVEGEADNDGLALGVRVSEADPESEVVDDGDKLLRCERAPHTANTTGVASAGRRSNMRHDPNNTHDETQ